MDELNNLNEQLNINESLLDEATRGELVSKSKKGSNYSKNNQSKGKNRYERRKYSKLPNQVKNYNNIDMNSFFKKDLLKVTLDVVGETASYKVIIKFNGILNEIRNNIKANNNKLEFRTIVQSLSKVFNSGDVYVWCSCPDWKYRFNYLAKQGRFNSGKDTGGLEWTELPDIMNPNDDKGAACKHVDLVLSNIGWMMKVASTINNYIHYAEEHMEQQFLGIIFPALYGMKPEKAMQLSLFPSDNRQYLKHSKGIINAINDYGKSRTKFKSGEANPKFNKDKQLQIKPDKNQLKINKKDLQTQEKEETK